MKSFLVVAILLQAFILISANTNQEWMERVKGPKYLKQIVSRYSRGRNISADFESFCPGSSETFQDAVASMQECHDAIPDSLTMCSAIHSYTENCSIPLVQVLHDCLPQKAKGLPAFYVRSVVSTFDYLCKQTGENLFELANPCVYNNGEDIDDKVGECLMEAGRPVKEFVESRSFEKLPSAAQICGVVTDAWTCWQPVINQSCKNQKTKNVIFGLKNAISAPCGAVVNEVNTTD